MDEGQYERPAGGGWRAAARAQLSVLVCVRVRGRSKNEGEGNLCIYILLFTPADLACKIK